MAAYESEVNYYVVLGVPENADTQAIRKAYLQKARETHPDQNNGKDEGFKSVKKAYDVLSNPALKAAYDESRKASDSLSEAAKVSAAPAAESEARRAFYSHASALTYASSSADSHSSASSLNANALKQCNLAVYISPALIRDGFIREAKRKNVAKSRATTFKDNFKDGAYILIQKLEYDPAEKCLTFEAQKTHDRFSSTNTIVYRINADALPLVVEQDGKYHHIGIIAASKKSSAAVFSHSPNLEEKDIVVQMNSQWKKHWNVYAYSPEQGVSSFQDSSEFELPLLQTEKDMAEEIITDLRGRTLFSMQEKIDAIEHAVKADSREALSEAYKMPERNPGRILFFGSSKTTQARLALEQGGQKTPLAITMEKK